MQAGGGRGGATPADLSEDCLFLNVWTAARDPNGKGLPTWPQYHANGNNQPMILGEKVDVQPDAARRALYDALYAKQKPR